MQEMGLQLILYHRHLVIGVMCLPGRMRQHLQKLAVAPTSTNQLRAAFTREESWKPNVRCIQSRTRMY